MSDIDRRSGLVCDYMCVADRLYKHLVKACSFQMKPQYLLVDSCPQSEVDNVVLNRLALENNWDIDMFREKYMLCVCHIKVFSHDLYYRQIQFIHHSISFFGTLNEIRLKSYLIRSGFLPSPYDSVVENLACSSMPSMDSLALSCAGLILDVGVDNLHNPPNLFIGVDSSHTPSNLSISVESCSPEYMNFGSFESSIWSSDSDSDSIVSTTHFTIQGDEQNIKDVNRNKFKQRNKSRKVDKVTDMILSKNLTKGEKKKLIAAVSKMTCNAGEVNMVPTVDDFDFSPIYNCFVDQPQVAKVIVEIVRLTTGVYIATTRAQVIHHLLFSATSLGVEFFPNMKDLLISLFSTEQAGVDFGVMFHETVKYWKENKILEDLKKGIIILLSVAFVNVPAIKEYFPSVFEFLGDPKLLKICAFDLVSYAMSAYLYMAERIKIAIETRSLKSLFVACPRLGDICTRYDATVHLAPHVLAGNIEMCRGVNIEDFTTASHKLLNELVALSKTCDKSDLVLIGRYRHIIFGICVQLESRLAERSVRPCPFAVNLVGTSGVGKTVLIPLIAKAIASAYKFTLEESDFYYRSPSDDYWSGYYGQRVLVEDEKNAMIATNSTVNENKVTLDVINNSIMRLNMADLPSKGIYTMRSDIYISTTNKIDAQASLNCNEPVAVLRRCIHIKVAAKDEFKKVGTDMLDPTKCTYNPLVDNAWLFTVMEAESVPSQDLGSASGWCWKILQDSDGRFLNNIELHDLFIFLNQRATQHIVNQKAILGNFADLFKVSLCDHGSGPVICRLCNPDLVRPHYDPRVPEMGGLVKNRHEVTTFVDQAGFVTLSAVFLFGTYISSFISAWYSKHWFLRVVAAKVRSKMFTSACRLISQCFSSVGYSPWNCLLAQVFNNFRTAFGSRQLSDAFMTVTWRQNPKKVAFLGLLYYFSLPFMFLFFTGHYGMYYILFGEATSAWVNRMMYQYYQRMDRRGATRSLADWAALKTRPFFASKWNYALIAGAVTTALAMYRLMNTKKLTVQGGVGSSEWHKPYVPPPVISNERRTTTWENLVTSLSSRIAHCTVHNIITKKCITVDAIPIKSGVWLLPAHALQDNDSKVWRAYTHVNMKFSSAKGAYVDNIPIDRTMVYFVKDRDIAFIHLLPTAGTMRDMSCFFTNDHVDCCATYVYRDSLGELSKFHDNTTRMKFLPTDSPVCPKGYMCLAPFPTFIGLCGAAQVSHSKCPAIISFHIAGLDNTRTSLCIPVYKDDVDIAIKSLFADSMRVETASFEDMDFSDGSGIAIGDSHHAKSPFSHLETGSYVFHGSVSERAKAKPTIVNTKMAPSVAQHFDATNIYGNPHKLRSWIPWYDCANMLVNPHFKDPGDLRSASTDYFGCLWDAIFTGKKYILKPLDYLTVFSGLDGDDFYKHINEQTSTGFPFKKKKSTCIEREYHPTDTVHQWHFKPDLWLQARIDAMEDRCRVGKRPNCVYSTSFKIEPKKILELVNGEYVEKISLPRIFYPAPVELIGLMRKYFMPLVELVQNCEFSEMSIGTNAMGPHWGQLASSLLKMSNFMMPADQEKFDRSVTADELSPIYNFLIKMGSEVGYTEEDITIMKSLVTCVIYPIIEFDTDLVSFYTLHGSGGFVTAQINSAVNSVRHRMMYYNPHFRSKLPSDLCSLVTKSLFRDFVTLRTYGDDSLPAVHEKLISYYNLQTFADYMSTQGVNVTNAQKVGKLIECIPLQECDYLKRSFRFDVERDVWTAPLNEASILKRLFVMDPSKVLTHEEQCGEALSSSLRDYFEYGRDVFDDRRIKLMKVASECGLINYVGCGFPCYDTFVSEYKSKYKSSPIPQPCGM